MTLSRVAGLVALGLAATAGAVGTPAEAGTLVDAGPPADAGTLAGPPPASTLAPPCALPPDVAQAAPRPASFAAMTPLCRAGAAKLRLFVDTAAGWVRAAPADPEARNWLSQALYNRALSRDHLPLPCAGPEQVDTGPRTGQTATQALLTRAHEKAQAGWNHTLFSAPARADAQVALCLADGVGGRERGTAYFRALRILIDLERDAELRARIGRTATVDGAPPRPGKPTELFMPYVEDYLGLAREIEAGELLLLFRDLDGPSEKLETARQALVRQIESYGEETKARTEKTAWLTAHGATEPWFAPPPDPRAAKNEAQDKVVRVFW